jgi:ribosomal protein S18 acetylase RimI-like enzyme
MDHLLHNVAWHTLTGAHALHAVGDAVVRRYARGFSPIVGFADFERPDYAALARWCEPGEQFHAVGGAGVAAPGWHVHADAVLVQMVRPAELAAPEDDALSAVRLGTEHVPQVLELTALTRPGPFGPRTIELGEYFGVFEAGRLVAMAGERMCVRGLREISGVCTHPSFQGRGLARRLMNKLIRRQALRDEAPFLHVLQTNSVARELYRSMGFSDRREVAVRVISLRA